MTEQRRMYKSRTNRMIAGVCGGVAEYFHIDPTIVRLLWFLSIFLGGAGIILYLAAIIIMPANLPGQASAESVQATYNGSRYFWGFILIGAGALLLLHNFGIIPLFYWWGGFSWKFVLALLLIVLGSILVVSYAREKSPSPSPEASQTGTEQRSIPRRLYRSLRDRKVFGVCGGMGEYFEIDPTIIRLLFVFVTLYSFGFGLIAYIILTIVTPEERLSTTVM
jgi:phage shock protein C